VTDVPPGWHRDPTGRYEQRYWDGASWTGTVTKAGDAGDDPLDHVLPPPLSPWGPPPPSRWRWFFFGVLSALVLMGGCAGIVALAVRDAKEALDAEQRRHAISEAQFDAVQLGASEAGVREQLGREPQNTQEFAQQDVLDEQAFERSCIYYNQQSGSFGDAFQFCFRDGVLISKGSL